MLHLHYRILATIPGPINGQSRTFTLKYPHHGSGTITLTANGVYNLSLNSWDTSDASARRTNEFKDALYNVSNDLIKAYDDSAAIYTNIHGRMIKLHRKSYYEGKLPQVVLETYEKKRFNIWPPQMQEVEGLLSSEAESVFHGKNATREEKTAYVKANSDRIFKERMEIFEEAKSLFDEIEVAHEQRENAAFTEKYNAEIKAQQDFLEGSEYLVKDALDSRMANATLPYTVGIDMSYNQEAHAMAIDIQLISGVYIPSMKATLLSSGKVSVKEKLVKESEEEKTISMLGIIYYIASIVFDASPNIDIVDVCLWDSQKENGYGWVRFPRKDLLHNTVQKFVPTVDVFNYERVMNLKESRGVLVLSPIKASVFKKQIDQLQK